MMCVMCRLLSLLLVAGLFRDPIQEPFTAVEEAVIEGNKVFGHIPGKYGVWWG